MKQNVKKIISVAVLAISILGASAFADSESFVGVGVTISKEKQGFLIINTIAQGPADKAGVKAGEWLMAVDGKSTEKKKLKDVIQWIAGERGTNVVFTVSDEHSTSDITMTRDLITVECYMKGNVSLSLSGDANYGQLGGWIGSHAVNMMVSSGQASGVYNGKQLYLTVQYDYNSLNIFGYVLGSYVNWNGSGNSIFNYQGCIY